jgi:hypothetical protein
VADAGAYRLTASLNASPAVNFAVFVKDINRFARLRIASEAHRSGPGCERAETNQLHSATVA